MHSYTTLGSGQNLKVLSVPDHGAARTITTAPAEAAPRIARALLATDRQMAAALYQPAVAASGAYVAARRMLLDKFDQLLADPATPLRTDVWEHADGLVARLAAAVTGCAAPVRAGVRAELADQLVGYDAVLVPARASTQGYKRMWLDVCVSQALDWLADDFWTYLFGPHSDLELVADDTVFPTGDVCVRSSELDELAHQLFDAEPCGTAWATGFDMEDLMRTAEAEQSPVAVGIRRDHLQAYVVHHQPAGHTTLPGLSNRP